MNTLQKTGAVLAATGTFFLAGCAIEHAAQPGPESGSPTDYSSPAPIPETVSSPPTAPETSSSSKQTAATEQQQKMHAILQQACGYVIAQDAHVKEGFPNVWSPDSPMYGYASEYNSLTGYAAGTTQDDPPFHADLKQSCLQYSEIYSKNNG